MKLAITVLTVLSLTACGGGSNNPFAPVVVDDAITVDTQSIAATDPDPVEPDPVQSTPEPTPEVTPAPTPAPDPVVQPPVATPEPTPPVVQETYLVRAWHCIDNGLGVVNDTWVDARLVEMYSDGSVIDPDRLYIRWDEGSNYINLYNEDWNHSGLSRVSDDYYASEYSACSETLPEIITTTTEQQMPEESAPIIANASTGEPVELTKANWTPEQFTANGRMWECVEVEYGVTGDFWSYTPGSKGVLHYQDGTADLFEQVNGSVVAAGTELSWSIIDGIYYGPLAIHGVEWVEDLGGKYSIWTDSRNKRDCYEHAD